MANTGGGSIVGGALWMLLLSILLFWLPVVGPLIAGVVGGKVAGGVGRAIAAVFLPALVVAILLFLLATSMTGLPLIGALAGMGGFVLVSVHVGPLLVGAILGGLLA